MRDEEEEEGRQLGGLCLFALREVINGGGGGPGLSTNCRVSVPLSAEEDPQRQKKESIQPRWWPHSL